MYRKWTFDIYKKSQSDFILTKFKSYQSCSSELIFIANEAGRIFSEAQPDGSNDPFVLFKIKEEANSKQIISGKATSTALLNWGFPPSCVPCQLAHCHQIDVIICLFVSNCESEDYVTRRDSTDTSDLKFLRIFFR